MAFGYGAYGPMGYGAMAIATVEANAGAYADQWYTDTDADADPLASWALSLLSFLFFGL